MKFLRPEIRKEARFHRYLPLWNPNGVRFRASLIIPFLSDSHFFFSRKQIYQSFKFPRFRCLIKPLSAHRPVCQLSFFFIPFARISFVRPCLQRSSERRISIHRVHDRSLNRQVSRNACAVHIDVTLLISTRCLTLFALHQSEWHYDRTLYSTKDREMFSWVCWLIPQYRFE